MSNSPQNWSISAECFRARSRIGRCRLNLAKLAPKLVPELVPKPARKLAPKQAPKLAPKLTKIENNKKESRIYQGGINFDRSTKNFAVQNQGPAELSQPLGGLSGQLFGTRSREVLPNLPDVLQKTLKGASTSQGQPEDRRRSNKCPKMGARGSASDPTSCC